MKKIVLMMLVAMVPFLTMAQKRSKKGKNVKTEKIFESNSTYNFMVIIGNEKNSEGQLKTYSKADSKKLQDVKSKITKTKMIINFDFGGIKSSDNKILLKNASLYMTMAAAVNGAANNGWEFISANVINGKAGNTHYYYMKRNK
jgi:hypothetical protein